MRRGMNIILAVFVTCSLMLTVQHSTLAQGKSKQKSQKSEKTQISGVERYRGITKNNLFMPLGSGDEVKRKEFILTGIMGNSAFIQMEGSGKSFFVTEGQSFGNDAKLVRIGGNSVTIVHEGNKKELQLSSGILMGKVGKDSGAKGGGNRQQQNNSGKNSKKMKTANSAGKGRGGGSGRKGGGKGGDDGQWAKKMSTGELRKARGDIAEYIEGLEKKGVRDPEAYEGAYKKMEMVEDAIADRGDSK